MLAQSTTDTGAAVLWVTLASVSVVLTYVLVAIPYYAIFTKAGQPGWAGFVPIYNWVVLFRVIGRPAWWVLLFVVPIVNVVVWIIAMVELAQSFGKGGWFTVGLILLNWIFLFILGFGDAVYEGPAAAAAVRAPRPDGVVPPPPR